MTSPSYPETLQRNSAERDPAEIEAGLASRRASLDSKLQEIEKRLNPRRYVVQIRSRLQRIPFVALGAASAVGAGAWMAISGLRHRRFTRATDDEQPIEYIS